ncbi:MAG: hypothetical protein ACK42D_02310 [Candidatus Paceibacteria bacterium]
MNNQNEQTRKERIMKGFAVAGFLAIIIIIAWLGIKFVSVLPSAFSSLASIADTVYNYKKPEVIVVANKSNLNNGESVSLSWQVPSQKGTFAISYACTEGVSVEIQDGEDFRLLNCNTNYNIGAVSGIDIFVFSERHRYTDIDFTIDFIPNNATEPSAFDTRKITVTNTNITADTDIEGEVDTPTSTPDPVVTPTPTPDPVTPPKQYVQVPIYGIPVSNPAGNTDLAARFINYGVLSANHVYTPRTSIGTNETGAIQFEVKNIGTKTSGTWAYVITLPNGTMYTSNHQAILKPNERSVITIGFSMDGVARGAKSTTLAVAVIGDSNLANNSFTTTIVVK